MNCPKCNQWNPDDKQVCWRCQAALPSPAPKKTKRPSQLFLGLPIWAWMVALLFLVVSSMGQCAFLPPAG